MDPETYNRYLLNNGLKEPRIHMVFDVLPYDHPLAWVSFSCDMCKQFLHAVTNENMDRCWVECGNGNYCIKCFASLAQEVEDGDVFALKD